MQACVFIPTHCPANRSRTMTPCEKSFLLAPGLTMLKRMGAERHRTEKGGQHVFFAGSLFGKAKDVSLVV